MSKHRRAPAVGVVGGLLFGGLLGGCAGGDSDVDVDDETCSRFATSVVSLDLGPGSGHGAENPDVVLGAPTGFDDGKQGTLDVLSLGAGGRITVAFDCPMAQGPGADFVVYENAFAVGDGGQVFGEAARVEVSVDGETFIPFPCVPPFGATVADDGLDGCAGLNPVRANAENDLGGVYPDGGGDGFDLATLNDPRLADGVQFVRIVDLATSAFAPTGGFDLDAVVMVTPATSK